MASSDQLDAATLVLVLLAAVVAIPMLVMVLGFGGMMGYSGMMGPYDGTVGWWPFVGMLVPLVVLLVLVGGGYLLLQRTAADAPARDPAMEELRAAYARGELTDEEFETRRERLERSE